MEPVPDIGGPPRPADPADAGNLDARTVVGVGSSAGGLEALQDLFRGAVPGSGATYVVAQHLAPDRPSAIVELLSKVCPLRVETAVDGQQLRPDTVYVGPPGQDVLVDGDRLVVHAPGPGFGPRPSIDELFGSIARSYGIGSVAVVLSGTGSDGSQGLREINSAEGLAIVQRPESARFDAMPRSALSLATVDAVLEPNQIGGFLAQVPAGHATETHVPPGQVEAVMAMVRAHTGLDLSGYRESTIRRQIGRRLTIRQAGTLADYLAMLDREPDEIDLLKQALLVSVTSFFRDPGAFEALREHLADLVPDWSDDRAIRVWVPGCATGEEVYSLAMVLADLMGDPVDLPSRLKVFGTDLDDDALAIARQASYPASALKSIPSELADRFVNVRGAQQLVAMVPRLRDSVVFARHNLTEDPPFPRLDLVSCRNVLIYFTPPLQKRVVERLRYPLVDGGLLFLGASESIGPEMTGLETLDASHRIYRRVGGPVTLPGRASPLRDWRPPSVAPIPRGASLVRDVVPQEHVTLLEGLVRLGPPSLILDEQNDLLEVVGDVSDFCQLAPGRLTAAALSYLKPDLEGEARALLLAGRAARGPLQGRALDLTGVGPVRLEVRPLPMAGRHLTVLSFLADTGPAVPTTPFERDSSMDQEMKRLERELLASQESLRTSLEELESANEELQASSEELQAASEELQSSYEELETSNEELEATNDELTSVNQQLRGRGEELQRLNDDLGNVQASVNQGMILVDRDLSVTSFTALAGRMFAIVPEDVGQSILAVPTTVAVPELAGALHAVVGGGTRRDFEVHGEGLAYLVQVVPYVDADGALQGAIVTLTDIRELHRLRRVAEDALADLEGLTDALTEAVWKRSTADGTLRYFSNRVEDLTGYSVAEVMADPEVLDAAIVDDDRDRVREVRSSASAGWDIEYQIEDRAGQPRWLREVASAMSPTSSDLVVGTLSDISDRHAAEQSAVDRAMVVESVFDTTVFGIGTLDGDDRFVTVNLTLSGLLGYEPAEMTGVPIGSLCHPDDRAAWAADLATLRSGSGSGLLPERQLVRADGGVVWADIDVRRMPRATGSTAALVIVRDVTVERANINRLSRHARYDATTGLVNRRTLYEVLDREISRSRRSGQPLALVWIDLDRFKEVNDQYGHEIGDVVLRAAADRMSWVVRRQDAVGRLGGDEFGIVVSGVNAVGDLDSWLDRLLEVLGEPIHEAGAEIRVGGSLGIAVYPEDGTSPDALMRAADHAMYEAKESGGSAYAFFQQRMTHEAEHRRALRSDLSAALADNEFRMWYQPVVEAVTGKLNSVEALVRWHRDDQKDKDGGVVAAADFISFAESSGQIRSLGLCTLDLLRQDLRVFADHGHTDLKTSVNLSVNQLSDPETVALMREVFIGPGRPPIMVEVTESVFLPDNTRAHDAVVLMERAGATIAVDDFGSGFSNLRLLRSLAPHQVKLDQSFLAMPRDSVEGRALMRSAVEMAHAMGAEVVAEGIEHEWQRELALDLGVDLLQGYLIARPMPAIDLMEWLDAYSGN